MNDFWKWTKNETTGERELRIEGIIDDSESWIDELLGNEVTTPKKFKNDLNSDVGDIIVRINSPGGNCYAAADIYSMLKEYKGKVTVKIDSYAASAATVIAMAGDMIEMSPLAMMCIHNPWLPSISGEAKDFIDAANYLVKLKNNIINAYEAKTKLPREKISELMDNEEYMNAKQALELGFADKIMFSDDEEKKVKALMYSPKKALNSVIRKFNAKKNNSSAHQNTQSQSASNKLNRLEAIKKMF